MNGKGLARLREAGVEVETGVLEAEAEELNPGYFHHRRTGLPWVTLKLASTLDGAVAARDGTSQWITSPDARADAHRFRAQSDAVMVGAGTLIGDDPALTVRIGGVSDHQPTPVVIAGRRDIPSRAQVFGRPTIVFSPQQRELPGEVIVVPGANGVDLDKALRMLGERGILDVLVEGGPTLAQSLLKAGLVQRGIFYLGSKLAGGSGLAPFGGSFDTLASATDVEVTAVDLIGSDVRVLFEVGGGA